jgi:hypothetical protein
VDGVVEQGFISPQGPGQGEGRRGKKALPAEMILSFRGGKGDTAPGAEGGSDERKRFHARKAEGFFPGPLQEGIAQGAGFLKNKTEKRGQGRADHSISSSNFSIF